MDVVLKIKRPRTPPFSINNAIDVILRREMDFYRNKINGEHPYLKATKDNLNLKPFLHPDINNWREGYVGIVYHDENSDITLHGVVDELLENGNNEVVVVDYKATARNKPVKELESSGWTDSYRRQLDVYVWLFKQNGFKTSDVAYFWYCTGNRNQMHFSHKLEFFEHFIPYKTNTDWIKEELIKVRETVEDNLPPYNLKCDYCMYNKKQENI